MWEKVDYLDLIMPVGLVVLAFFVKLAVDRRVKAPYLIEAMLEFPVDLVILGASFVAAFTLSRILETKPGMVLFVVHVIVAVVVAIFWREGVRLFQTERFWRSAALGIVSYIFWGVTLGLFLWITFGGR